MVGTCRLWTTLDLPALPLAPWVLPCWQLSFPSWMTKHNGFHFPHIQTPRPNVPRSCCEFPGTVPQDGLSPSALFYIAAGTSPVMPASGRSGLQDWTDFFSF